MFQFRTMSLSDSGSVKRIKGGKKQFGYCHLFFSLFSVYFQRDKNIYTEGQAWLTEKTQKRPLCFSLIQAWIRSFSSGTVERGKKYTESALYGLTIKKQDEPLSAFGTGLKEAIFEKLCVVVTWFQHALCERLSVEGVGGRVQEVSQNDGSVHDVARWKLHGISHKSVHQRICLGRTSLLFTNSNRLVNLFLHYRSSVWGQQD